MVANNILVGEGDDVFSFGDGTTNILVDYNLCNPKSARQEAHGLTGDPRFVDATRGVFWLRTESPAIAKGSAQHAPASDFWGRPRPRDKGPDLGAFAFEPLLIQPQVRANWDGGWAYHRHGNKVGLPDPWVLPPSGPGKE